LQKKKIIMPKNAATEHQITTKQRKNREKRNHPTVFETSLPKQW
jgi:hypothetical protein